MSSICYVTEEILNSNRNLSDFKPFRGKLSDSNIATLAEIFEIALKDITSDSIKDILVNSTGHFLFLIEEDIESDFDFYDFINKNYQNQKAGLTITCTNIKWLFPRGRSKGIYSGLSDIEENTDDFDEESTGYIGEDEILALTSGLNISLKYLKQDTNIPISYKDTVIGRSVRTTDFVIHGNTNVSRNHCKVYKTKGGSVKIEDLGSANGTYLNGKKLEPHKPTEVHIGDVILIADEEFTVE